MYITRRTVGLLYSMLCVVCGLWEGGEGSRCWEQEREALLDLDKARTTLAAGALVMPNNVSELWEEWDLTAADCCEWQGVTCDAQSGRVIELRPPHCEPADGVFLPYEDAREAPERCNYVCSSLPPSLSQLEALQLLNLSAGCFHGNLSSHILAPLHSLSHLDLSLSFFRFPSHLPPLPNLTHFNFSLSLLNTPPSLNLSNLARALPNLKFLYLGGFFNREGGSSSIPSEFSASFLPHLAYLDLSYTRLQGIIPDHLGSLHSLIYLRLEGNSFRNPLPWPSLANLSHLTHLSLGNNAYDGQDFLVWEEGQADWHCKWNALESLSSQNMRFASNNSTPFCLGDPAVMSKLTTLSFRGHHGSIGPLLHSLSLPKAPLRLKDLSLLGTSLAEFQAQDWLHPLDAPFLESLDVLGNSLTSLPSWLPVQLPLLQELYITENLLSELPSNLQQLHSLRVLDISSNRITASLHQLELWNFTQLQRLSLSGNSFTGAIPLSFLLPSLSSLDLRDNMVSGGIPFSIGNMSMLSELYLSRNSLGGTIPLSLGNLPQLSMLDLSYNDLSGEIPLSLGSLPQLSWLDLSHNELSGEIPVCMENITVLSGLRLSYNSLTGTIPPFIFHLLPMQSYIDLSHNQLSGNLPPISQNCSTFSNLDLSSNNLLGGLSQLFQNCNFSFSLDLSNNSFSGPLPQFYHGCTLVELDLSSNNLSGDIPDQIFTSCTQLSAVNLGQNSFSLGIPASVANLVQLEALTLDNNNLSGEIPAALHNCSLLAILDLSYNRLSGTIPGWITGVNFPRMVVLMLSNNQFHGSIPLALLANLTSLQILNLANNHLSGFIPTHLDFLVGMTYEGKPSYLYTPVIIPMKGSNWQISGSNLNDTVMLDLSNNLLEGPIPPQIGALKGLRILNFSHNALNGSIPGTLGNLSGTLESLDLSHNQFTGGIPPEFCSLHFLGDLDVSNNRLSGVIPDTCSQMSTFNASAFANNEGLCGSPLPQCVAPAPSQMEVVQVEAHPTWFTRVQEVVSIEAFGIGYALGLLVTSVFLYFRAQLAHACLSLLSSCICH